MTEVYGLSTGKKCLQVQAYGSLKVIFHTTVHAESIEWKQKSKHLSAHGQSWKCEAWDLEYINMEVPDQVILKGKLP